VTAGTIFQDTRTPLPVWFRAMWWVTTQKNGASALGLQRVLGLKSYETAWAWLHKLRRAMVRPGRDRLTGRVEVDECYVGGPEEGLPGRLNLEKTLVVVAAQEDGLGIDRIRMRQIIDASAESLVPFVQDSVEPGSVIHTEGWLGLARRATIPCDVSDSPACGQTPWQRQTSWQKAPLPPAREGRMKYPFW
jgi:hypothetical protein